MKKPSPSITRIEGNPKNRLHRYADGYFDTRASCNCKNLCYKVRLYWKFIKGEFTTSGLANCQEKISK